MKTYNIDYFFKEDIIYQLSSLSEKPVIYFRADGPKSCDDIQKIEEVWDFYFGKADGSILSGLQQTGEVYCYFMDLNQAYDAFNEWFPQKTDLTDDEMHFYVYAQLVSVKDSVDIINGV